MFFSYKEQFSKFRQVNKKFNSCFKKRLIYVVEKEINYLKLYSKQDINEAKAEIENNLTIVSRINTMGEQLRAIRGNPSTLTEKKLYIALHLLTHNQMPKIKHSEEGEPIFETNDIYLTNNVFTNIKSCLPIRFFNLRRFIQFYGPKFNEFKEWRKKNRVKDDIKMTYIQTVLDYYFNRRYLLKKRSKLHRAILMHEERG